MIKKGENLIPPFSDSAWRIHDLPYGEKAEFTVSSDGESATIKTAPDYGLGKWICSVPVEGGAFYDFTASCKTDIDECDAFLIVTQYDVYGNTPIREHVKDTVRDGEYLRFSDKLDMASKTVKLEIELWAKGKSANALWERPTLVLSDPLPERKVKVAAVQMRWGKELGRTEEIRKEEYLRLADEAGARGADLLVFGEGLYSGGFGLPLHVRARERDAKMLVTLGKKAIEHNMYIVFCGIEEDGDHYYNTAFIIDRAGKMIGKYRKTHITAGEYEDGFTPGEDFPVFDLDFGRVGILICYDQFFPETAKELAKKGAEIICIPTAGDDSHACMSLAMDSGVYLAVAGMNKENNYGWGPTRIVDPLGNLISDTEENFTLAFAEIDLNKKVRRFWMSTGPAYSSVHDDYRYEVNPHSFNNK